MLIGSLIVNNKYFVTLWLHYNDDREERRKHRFQLVAKVSVVRYHLVVIQLIVYAKRLEQQKMRVRKHVREQQQLISHLNGLASNFGLTFMID